MGNIIITKEREHSWDVTVYDDKGPVRRAWAMNRDQAIGKAEILADFYRDDNGQSGSIIINEKSI
jgi:hypothetical protein